MGTKICNQCCVEKDSSDFTKVSRNRDGLSIYCKSCEKLKRESGFRDYRDFYSDETSLKTCSVCNNEKSISEFSPDKRGVDGLAPRCRKCKKEYDRRWVSDNQEKVILSRIKFRESHPDHYDNYYKTWAESNVIRLKEIKKKHYNVNKESHNENAKQWALSNPDKRKQIARRYRNKR